MSRDSDDRARHDADALRPDQQGTGQDADELPPDSAPDSAPGTAHDSEPPETPRAAPADSVSNDPTAGAEPMPEVPGGPQVDVPAAQGHLDDDGRRS